MLGWKRIACLLFLSASGSACCGQLTVTPEQPDGLYAVGGTAVWTISPSQSATIHQASYSLRLNGQKTPIQQGTLDLSKGSATVQYQGDQPGHVILEVTALPATPATQPTTDSSGKSNAVVPPIRYGAVFGAGRIHAALPRPDDFDQWWSEKLAELDAVSINAQVEPADTNVPGVEYYKLSLDNIRGTHVRGQLAKPAGPGKFPAVLQLQYAGVYPLQKDWVIHYAKAGWLALNVSAHDIPIDDKATIDRLLREGFGNYQAIGNTDREKSYFLRMYLGDCRALQYLASRPEWDGKTLVVVGDSMGGQQTFATVGLVGEKLGVTAMLANVPAGGDVGARSAGRLMAYPNWPETPEAIQTARYFDIANFAPRIKANAFVSFGLFDTVCPPTSVLSAYNELAGPKELYSMHSDHFGPDQRPRDNRRNEWLDALLHGRPIPERSNR